jgi:hypothetical protein
MSGGEWTKGNQIANPEAPIQYYMFRFLAIYNKGQDSVAIAAVR